MFSFFEKAATAEQKVAFQQQKEQQLATDRAKLQQAKAEQAEWRTEEAAMKRPPGRPKNESSLTGQLVCGDTERAQGHSLAGALAKETKLQRLRMQSSPVAGWQLAVTHQGCPHPSSTISTREQQPQQRGERGGQQQQ
jgi:glutamate synthase domain-containing protein 3